MKQFYFEESVERLIRISKEKPLLPETYVPWADEPKDDTLFMPEKLVSLEGHPLWHKLSREQQIELGRLEVVQVMYSYAWSETLACYFFQRHLLGLDPDSVEYRFLLREIIEESRHQEMFGMAIRKLDRKPVKPTGLHRLFAYLTVRWFPDSWMFISVLAIEHMADTYAHHMRRDPGVFSVIRKCSQLHHIEEGRHIQYAEWWLKRFTDSAGFFKITILSLITLANIIFMRSFYVQRAFFKELGTGDSDTLYRAARTHYRKKFAGLAAEESVRFVNSFRGFNFITRPLWNFFLLNPSASNQNPK